MRTTLTLDDDVAYELDRLRRERDVPLRTVVNETLRAGLSQVPISAEPQVTATVAVSHGRLLLDIDDASEALALAEGEDFR